ncbi:GTPase [Xylariomycetidae sp. FL0641]|nr:GTPase [Xylariomycetidae sp. FL0641]
MEPDSRLTAIPPPEMETTNAADQDGSPSGWSQDPAGDTLPRDTDKTTARRSRRTNSRPSVSLQQTIRTVTPDPAENGHALVDTNIAQAARGYGTTSPQSHTSPRPVPGGERRRQGMVFNEAFAEPLEHTSPSSPLAQQRAAYRPRTQTMDAALTSRQQTISPIDSRHRVGSVSSSGSQAYPDVEVRTPPTVPESVSFPALSPGPPPSRPPDLKIAVSNKDKKSNRRLIKRANSRPTSPLVSPPPSVDSLPLPVPTDDANRILLLMKTLCGRMRGEVEYQSEPNGPWHSGVCYIDEDRGSLLCDPGENGPFHTPIVGDLRGCRILPIELPGMESKCLELSNPKMSLELLLRPLVAEEFDLWLASLLCWQQLRPSGVRLTNGGRNSPGSSKAEVRRRGSSAATATSKDAAIIKVGKVTLWDKGAALSPRAIVKRPSTRDLRSSSTSWRRVSCILQDDGEFKLMTENDIAVLSVIELPQLSRCAIQQLDKSVLDEEYCIAIFPIYASTSTQLSIFRPVYLALDSRVLFEVWFVLLRCFAIPDLYLLDPASGQVSDITDFGTEYDGQLFRLEKTIQVRVTEAKIGKPTPIPDQYGGHGKERDPYAGHYLAEVILDGEVRSRTATQTDTKNPFWRENAQFTELPASLPYLSVILKRVDGNLESFSHQLQASLGLPKTGNLTEVMCGSVDIPLDKMERAKDHEQWFQICDEKQEAMGSMFVRVNHDELVVLASEDYRPLSELLHQFSSGLTGQIAQSLPGQMRRLSEILLNIFQVSGASSEWLMALVEDEIDGIGSQNSMKRLRFSRRLKSGESSTSASDREQIVRDMGKSLAGEANLLFRGNTLLTQSLEFHMRRLGKEYLEEMLTDKIFEINELNPDCEVDPSRMAKPEDVQSHWSQLTQLTTEVWECIAVTATRLPAELRQILKYVRAVAEDRYGDFLRTVNYTSVSGFLFLRFICPAILNPKIFGLLRDNPRPRAQRTFTLIAKGLQALANLSTFGKKEGWMEPMNKFLSLHRQSFKDFIDQMCSIPTERNVLTTPASYSTPIMMLGRLTPTFREGFPSLPYLIDHQRSFAALIKLWLECNNANPAELRSSEGDLAEFHQICADLQRRSDDCLARIEMLRAEEALSLATDEVADSLEKAASLIDSTGLPGYAENESRRSPGSSSSEPDGDKPSHKSNNREISARRHRSDHLDFLDFSHPLSTIRGKGRSHKDPRSFLSGLIGSKKSKDAASPSMSREKSRDKDEKGARGLLGSLTDSRQTHDSSSRH